MWALLQHDTRRRRWLLALGVYALTTSVFFAFAARERLTSHTPYNHFALLAEAWLDGRLALAGPPPAYAGNNDFALHDGRWYIVFPPFPALLLVPLVKLGGSAERVYDGQVFLWLAGVAPAALFLALEALRRLGQSQRRVREHLALALLFALGTVYWFSAEQGTVWFAAHVVGAGLGALYLLGSVGGRHPLAAGLCLGLGYLTRSPLLFAAPYFLFESWRAMAPVPGHARWRRLAAAWGLFALPVVAALAFTAWHNQARFGSPTEFGYRYLTVAWAERMQRWGLFHYHYLGKNLGVVLTSLPWRTLPPAAAPFQINGHGLALWVTTPLYLWLLWPARRQRELMGLWVTALAVAVPTLFYQNTGWVQFGYRFSNDYAPFLFALLALGGRRFGKLFWLAAAWSVLVNAFGALSFERAGFAKYYFIDRSQQVLHQPD